MELGVNYDILRRANFLIFLLLRPRNFAPKLYSLHTAWP